MKYPILTAIAFGMLIYGCREKKEEELTPLMTNPPLSFNFVLLDHEGKSVIDNDDEISLWYRGDRLLWRLNHGGQTLPIPYDYMIISQNIPYMSADKIKTFFLLTKTPDGITDMDTLYVDAAWESRPDLRPHYYRQITFNGRPVVEGTDSVRAHFYILRKTMPPPVAHEYEQADRR